MMLCSIVEFLQIVVVNIYNIWSISGRRRWEECAKIIMAALKTFLIRLWNMVKCAIKLLYIHIHIYHIRSIMNFILM